MTGKTLYGYALDQATAVVVQIRDDQWELPTPDTEWTVRALFGHMLYELAWTADIVKGKTVAAVGAAYDGDLAGDSPADSWRDYEAGTRQAVEACDPAATAHLSYADKPVEDYLWEAGNDQLIHAWDLGQAIGVSVVFDEAAAQALYDRALERQAELSGSGLFGAPVPVTEDATIQTKLLGLLGRSADWKSHH